MVCLTLLALLASACGTAGGRGAQSREVISAIEATHGMPHAFRYLDERLDGTQQIVVEGEIEDDLRFTGTVYLNGRPLYEQVVSDDSVALRVLDIEQMRPAIDAAAGADAPTGNALREGRWVVDHTIAPPLAGAAAVPDEEVTADVPLPARLAAVGDDPFGDASQIFSYSERTVRSSPGMQIFNPGDIDYNALDDPWAADAQARLQDQGIRRYDLSLPSLPPPAQRGQQQALPTVTHFRKMAVYVRGNRVERIREQISISDRREFRRAADGRGAQFYLQLRDNARRGGVQGEFRERVMSYEVTRFGPVGVSLPDDAVVGFLGQAMPMIKALFGFEFIRGAGAAGPAGLPAPGAPEEEPAAEQGPTEPAAEQSPSSEEPAGAPPNGAGDGDDGEIVVETGDADAP